MKFVSRLVNDGAEIFLVPGEVWTDGLNRDLAALDTSQREAWLGLLRHCLTATAARPSAKWLKTAAKLMQAVGGEQVRGAISRWFPQVAQGSSVRKIRSYSSDCAAGCDTMHDENADCLRGLLWCVPLLPERDRMARSITQVALSPTRSYRGLVPGRRRSATRPCSPCPQLKSTEAVGQLAMLKVRVKFGHGAEGDREGLHHRRRVLGLPRDQIEELGVPSYGLEDVGLRRESLGEYRAELIVAGSHAALKWFDTKGKTLKSVPAKVKSDHKDDLKELQQSLKDIQSMLPPSAIGSTRLFLLQRPGRWKSGASVTWTTRWSAPSHGG